MDDDIRIEDGQAWMDMIKDRNLAAHSYDEAAAEKLAAAITGSHYRRFSAFAEKMSGLT